MNTFEALILTAGGDPLFTAEFPKGTTFIAGDKLTCESSTDPRWSVGNVIIDEIKPTEHDGDQILDIYVDLITL